MTATDDRTLLEDAARAAGLVGFTFINGTGAVYDPQPGVIQPYRQWNPLTDNGDALWLAVKLRIDAKWHFGLDDSVFAGVAYKGETQMRERLQQDDNAATRRAIVRAAAAMAPKEG